MYIYIYVQYLAKSCKGTFDAPVSYHLGKEDAINVASRLHIEHPKADAPVSWFNNKAHAFMLTS